MKKIVINKNQLLDNDINMIENRVKMIIRNKKDEILLCKINGVYHFVGGHIEEGESIEDCAKRETLEETGIDLQGCIIIPFLQLIQYEKNYYNRGKNCLSTINYMEVMTEESFNYDNRNLDSQESTKDFQLSYIHMRDIINELENNRDNAKKQGREFIINEMEYIISEYKKYLLDKDDMEI